MEYRYVLLEFGRGMGVFVNIEEVNDPIPGDEIITISDGVSLTIEDTAMAKEVLILKWVVKAIRDLLPDLYQVIHSKQVCYKIISIDYDLVDFQEEGLYYCVRGWFGKYYGLTIPSPDIYFNKAENKFVFPLLS